MSWIERQPAGDVELIRLSCASDSDGSNLIVGDDHTAYVSHDAGVSWTDVMLAWPEDEDERNGVCVASDGDGSNLIAGEQSAESTPGRGGRLWISTNAGATWSETQPVGNVNRNWRAVASDASGLHLMAAFSSGAEDPMWTPADAGMMFTSDDGGATWTPHSLVTAVGQDFWNGPYFSRIACDDDGSNIIGAPFGMSSSWITSPLPLYLSSDGGVTWRTVRPTGASGIGWLSCASDADGSNLLASDFGKGENGNISGAFGGRLWLSTDAGVTWTETRPNGDRDEFWGCASNSDGSVLVATCYLLEQYGWLVDGSFGVFVSKDGGATWVQQYPSTNNSQLWTTVDCSDDGSFIIVGSDRRTTSDKGRLYTSFAPLWVLNYSADSHGSITGTTPQYVDDGGSGTPVVPVSASGYSFTYWTRDAVINGTQNPRTDTNVHEDRDIIAYFTLNACIAKVWRWVGRVRLGKVKEVT